MGRYMLEMRDDMSKEEMLEYAYKIKDMACKMIESLEGGEMQERNRYRGGMSYRNRYHDDEMEYRRGRYSD